MVLSFLCRVRTKMCHLLVGRSVARLNVRENASAPLSQLDLLPFGRIEREKRLSPFAV